VVDLVALDVNETLFPLDPIADRMQEVGLPGQLDVWFARVLRDGMAAAAAGRLAAFADLARHHLLELLAAAGATASEAAVDHVLEGFQHVQPHPDVEPGLRALRDAGIEVVTLTNGAAPITAAFLERAGFDGLVAAVHDVSDAGRWKPAGEPYRWLVDRHGVPPARAAMVAVHPWDVMGAQAAGLVGAWLDRGGVTYPSAFGAPDVQAADLPTLVTRLIDAP
jgi:2-haloacid dehalogenase